MSPDQVVGMEMALSLHPIHVGLESNHDTDDFCAFREASLQGGTGLNVELGNADGCDSGFGWKGEVRLGLTMKGQRPFRETGSSIRWSRAQMKDPFLANPELSQYMI